MRARRLTAAVLIQGGGKTLLVKQSAKKGGKWGIPGGHEEEGDGSILGTALRECREETGYDIVFDTGTTSSATPVGSFETPTSVGLVFRGRIVGGAGRPLAGDVEEIGWFTEEEIHGLFEKGQLYRSEINLPILVERLTKDELDFLYSPDTFWDPEFPQSVRWG